MDSKGDLAGGGCFVMKKLLDALGHRDRNRDRSRHGYRFLTANYHHYQWQKPIAIPILSSLADFAVALAGRPLGLPSEASRLDFGVIIRS